MSSRSASTGVSTRSTRSARCSASQAALKHRPMPTFIPARGPTLHLAGVCVNRIGTDQYYAETNPNVREALRDRVVLGQMRAYDIQFASFQREIYGNSNLVSAGADIVVLAANAVATVSGTAVTKAALAAGSAGVVGTQGAISKDLFYQRTIPALLAQMEANRANAKATIMAGLKLSDADYSLPQAYIDLETLRNAAGIP